MKYLMTYLTIFLIVFHINAQEHPGLSKEAFEGIREIKTANYGKEALWGYINGGADLYLEYGFENLTVQNIAYDDSEFRTDIYRMTSPQAAYGIFSVSRFRCNESGILHRYDCLTPYQYIAAKGDYYISVSNKTGSLKHQEITLKIAASILDKTEDQAFQFPGLFNIDILAGSRDNLKFISGELGMQNGFMKWDEMFRGFNAYEAWIITSEFLEWEFNLGWVRFADIETYERFLKSNKILTPEPAYLEPTDEQGQYFFRVDDAIIILEGPLPEPLYYRILNLFYNRF